MLRAMSILLVLALTSASISSAYGRTLPPVTVAPVASAKDKTPPPQYETRVYVRKQCLISERRILPEGDRQELFGAIAAIFVPLLIEKAIGGIAAALKKAGAEETLRDTGTLPTYLYEISDTSGTRTLSFNPNMGCLLVVRGTFNGPDPEDQSVMNFSSAEGQTLVEPTQLEQRKTRLRDSNIPVVDIALLYEGLIRQSNDSVAIYYQSRFLEVHSFQGSRSSNTRGLVLGVAMIGPGPKEGEPTLSVALMNLGEVQKDAVLDSRQLYSRRSQWLGGIGLTEEGLAAIEKTKLKPNETKGVVPITMQVTLAETENGNKALRFIGEVLEASKEDLTKAVSSEILDKEKRATAAAEAREKLRVDEESAYAEFLKALAELDAVGLSDAAIANPPDNATAAQKVKIFEAQRTLRLWCAKLNALKNIGETPSGTRRSCP